MSNLLKQSTFNLLPPRVRQDDLSQRSDLKRFYEALDLFLDDLEDDTISVIRTEGRVETASEATLRMLAWQLGFHTLPDGAFSRLRPFLVNSAEAKGHKGDFEVLIDTIFLTTGLIATIYVPWQDPLFLEVGISEIGESDAEVGMDYASNYDLSFTMGKSAIGVTATIGDKSVNPKAPYTFYVDLLFEPDAERLNVLNWTIARFKRAIDKVVIRWPFIDISDCWVIGEVETNSTQVVNRIILADGSALPDNTIAFDGTSTNGSRIGIDTIICLGCFEVGVSPVGGAIICDTSDSQIYILNWIKSYAKRRRWF